MYDYINWMFSESRNRIYYELIQCRFKRSINDIVSDLKKFHYCFLESGCNCFMFFYYTENENRIYFELIQYRFKRSINDIVSDLK